MKFGYAVMKKKTLYLLDSASFPDSELCTLENQG